MAITTYVAGKLNVEAVQVANVFEGTLSVDVETGDTKCIGLTWDRAIEMGKGWTITGSCYYDPSDTAQAAIRTGFTTGDAHFSAVDLWQSASHYFGGSALLTNATVSRGVGSPDKLNLSFHGLAALAYT